MSCDDRQKTIGPRSPALPRSMQQACASVGLDGNGTRCPECPLARLCASELRWLVRRKLARRLLH